MLHHLLLHAASPATACCITCYCSPQDAAYAIPASSLVHLVLLPQASDVVQQEDVWLCEMVQKGLQSPGYDVGRYAPEVEAPMFHFHQLVYQALRPVLGLPVQAA